MAHVSNRGLLAEKINSGVQNEQTNKLCFKIQMNWVEDKCHKQAKIKSIVVHHKENCSMDGKQPKNKLKFRECALIALLRKWCIW